MSKSEVIIILNSYIRLLRKAGIPIEKAYLHGSYAHDNASESSDIDVMLISPFFDTTDDLILSSPWRYTVKIDHRIEPVAIGSERYKSDDISPIIQIVKKEGIEIRA
jgi:predicted nucleotidyltransferase